MKKYWPIFKISFQQEFAYRFNFVMWRVRNVLQIFLIFFLWNTIFSDNSKALFGYDREKILTYVLLLLIIKSYVMSSRSIDIAGEVARGELANYLLKPVSYFKYWFTRDLSSKALNLIFASVEILLLYVILNPPFFFQTKLDFLALFVVSLIISIFLFFLLLFLFNMFPLWYPEQPWGPTFLLLTFVEFLGGGIFPIDILPDKVQKILYFTPFPHLIFSPIQIYLGKFDLMTSVKTLSVGCLWLVILFFIVKKVWNLGLKVYTSEGR